MDRGPRTPARPRDLRILGALPAAAPHAAPPQVEDVDLPDADPALHDRIHRQLDQHKGRWAGQALGVIKATQHRFVGGPALGEFFAPSRRCIGNTPRSTVVNLSRRRANCVGDGSTMGARRQRISIRPCRIQDRLTQGSNALKSGFIEHRTSRVLVKTDGDL